jgi:hypothetical protein
MLVFHIKDNKMDIKLFKTFFISLLHGNLCYANEVASVLGYSDATNNELWQQKKVGFGVANVLQQALMDNTDFSLLDEKIVSGIGDTDVESKLQADWMLNENKTASNTLKELAKKHNLNHIFWVKITDFFSRTTKVSVAIFNSSEYKDTLTLEVCHYTVAANTTECQEGEGTQSRTLTGVLYKPIEKVNFGETGAGQLSQEAINQSLTKLLHHE